MKKHEISFIETLREQITNWSKTEIAKVNRWSKYIIHTPDLIHLVIKLSNEEAIPVDSRAKLAAVISYFMSPMDMIPESYWGALGYVDDIALAAYLLKFIQNQVGSELLNKHWTGQTDLTELITGIVADAEPMVGKDYWPKLKTTLKLPENF